jgi:hypothetical protein
MLRNGEGKQSERDGKRGGRGDREMLRIAEVKQRERER